MMIMIIIIIVVIIIISNNNNHDYNDNYNITMFLSVLSDSSSWRAELLRQMNLLWHYLCTLAKKKKKKFKLSERLKIKGKACLFSEIPVVDAARRVSLYLVPSMLMIVEDHLFLQCQVYCELLITVEKHD